MVAASVAARRCSMVLLGTITFGGTSVKMTPRSSRGTRLAPRPKRLQEAPANWCHFSALLVPEVIFQRGLLVSGGVVPHAQLVCCGASVLPLSYSSCSKEGMFFEVAGLSALVADLEVGTSGGLRFLHGPRAAQHPGLVLPGSEGAAAAATVVAFCPSPDCSYSTKTPAKMRQHAGAHILSGSGGALRGLCGFCGQPLTPDSCVTSVTKLDKAASSKLISSCPLFPGPSMSYKAAIKYSASSPCTNMPIACPEGTCVDQKSQIWRYNIGAHFSIAHGALSATASVVEAAQLLQCRQQRCGG